MLDLLLKAICNDTIQEALWAELSKVEFNSSELETVICKCDSLTQTLSLDLSHSHFTDNLVQSPRDDPDRSYVSSDHSGLSEALSELSLDKGPAVVDLHAVQSKATQV